MIHKTYIQKFKIIDFLLRTLFIFLCCICISCEDLVELDLPDSQLNASNVFQDEQTANSAIGELYARLRDDVLLTGSNKGVSFLLGLYTDELTNYNPNDLNRQQFFQNSILASNDYIENWWQKSYNLIYACNLAIEKLEDSQLQSEKGNRLLGQALFIRSVVYYYLEEIYGDIPYTTTTDYEVNTHLNKTGATEVLGSVLADVEQAKGLLPQEDFSGDHTTITKSTATAFLARIALELKLWEMAKVYSSNLIENTSFTIDVSLDQIFLNNSPSTIWQLKSETPGANTHEGMNYIFFTAPPPNISLSNNLIVSFNSKDLRFQKWTKKIEDSVNAYYEPYKYRLNEPTPVSQEYSIMLRLAEQYLIRSEARFQLGDNEGALADINVLRSRAGLPLLEGELSCENLALEWYHEFFTEFGHRFISLKRLDLANEILGIHKENWKETDSLLPLPDSEIIINPNLKPQNSGY